MPRPAPCPALRLLCAAVLSLLLAPAAALASDAEVMDLKDREPEQTSFTLMVQNYVLDDMDKPKRTEADVVAPEKAAILALVDKGYHYVAGGEGAALRITAHMLCADPKEAAGARGPREVIIPGGADPFFLPDIPRPAEVYTWSPALMRLSQAPDSCAGAIVLVATTGEETSPQPVWVAHGGASCPFDMGCPFESCQETLNQALVEMVKRYF